ncbi:MAG: hypothetical protein HRU11_11035 [Parvularculaceae bacterium]|nr:hypothetical protein [Parvularculaceae bacterium]
MKDIPNKTLDQNSVDQALEDLRETLLHTTDIERTTIILTQINRQVASLLLTGTLAADPHG